MKALIPYLKPYWKWMALAAASMSLSTVCDLMLPTIMSELLNSGVYLADMDRVLRCCLGMLAVALVGIGAYLLGLRLSTKVVAEFCRDLRGTVFQKVHGMTFEEFGKLGTAALVTRASHDVQTVSWIASELCGTVIMIPVLFFGGVFLAMAKDVALSLVLLAVVPVIIVVVLRVGRTIIPLWEKADEYIDKTNGFMRQRLRGIRVIRAFNAEDREHEKIEHAIDVMSESFIRSNIAMGLISPLAMLLLNLVAVLVVWFGGIRLDQGSGLTGGDIFAIIQYISLVSNGLIMGAFTIIMFPQAQVAAKRIGQVLTAQTMADPVARQNLALSGDIRFQNVTFRYQGADEPALEAVDFHIRPGEKIAVIGGTGAGKSTLVSMLLGFHVPTQGHVLLDGRPTTELSRHAMRENMAVVLQNATIYSGTIRDNVRMGDPNATQEQILEALEAAQAMEFVGTFPEGLDHVIKQSGKNLSGGQRQRLSIARALLRQVPIYVFDDSFSALDFLTEANLRQALNTRLQGRTQLIITQRITSAMHCDRILVLDRGVLVDQGNHRELLDRCRVYQEIYASQTGGGLDERE